METKLAANKKSFWWIFIVSCIISSILNFIVNKITGLEYNSFTISKLLLNLLMSALCFIPVYLLAKRISNKKYGSLILETLFAAIILLFTVLTDLGIIVSRSGMIHSICSLIICMICFIWGINFINKKNIAIGVLLISASSVSIFGNIILLILKTRC
ncbi:MAG: hypothetical protein LIR50_15180 [Bacillota bacterium]|nr:hypothetical protein [Bacillota bacterium]